MFMFLSLALLAASRLALAEQLTTLNLPGFSQQSLSADFLSLDSQGRTVWAVQGVLLSGTATLVEGPGYASVDYKNDGDIVLVSLKQECSITGNTAVCSGNLNGAVETITNKFFHPVIVEVGTAPPTAPTAATSGGVSGTLKPGSTASAPKPTGSGSLNGTAAELSSNANEAALTMAPGFSTAWMTILVLISIII
ncbi:hypothetical protein AMATHDRAFT_2703 [Amanita thiersii Skay4041]|uniref:Uncharacterized protein n=1 Tax=Amanita thiersii Skay4041 TaxID=703135 RepID=A0A2A9NVN4_9AGAR|nr:hypothetical protein AMATHDRAFT_2703 [Amanita thiersii Skay4041]